MLVQFISVCSICFSFFSYWLSQENIHQRVSRLCAKNNYGEKCWSRPIPYNSGPILQHIHLQLLPQQELLHDYEHLGFWKILRNNINQTVTSKKSPCMDPFLSVDTLYLTCYYTYYHNKTHSMIIMTIWTFEKASGYNIKKLLRAKGPHTLETWTYSWVWTPCTTSPFSASLHALSIYEPR